MRQLSSVLILALLSCAPAVQSRTIEPDVTERLYFGRDVQGKSTVSDSAWRVFVDEVVSVQLPAGFTFWSAEGAWRDSTGRQIREPSFIVEVVHAAGAAAADSAIAVVIAEYKRRFNQEAVLRVVTPGRARF